MSAGKMFFWLLIAGMFFLALAFERVELRKSGMRVGKIKQEVSQKEARNQYLRFKIAEVNAPAVVYKEAGEKLHLRLTPAKNIIVLDNTDDK